MSYIKCGDSKELLKEIPDNSVDLVIIDPPYVFDERGGGGAFGSKKKRYHEEYAEVSTFHSALDQRKANQRSGLGELLVSGFTDEIIDELIRVMKKVNIYIYGAVRHSYCGL